MAREITVQKPVRIPEEDAEWFAANYPMNGAWTWWVRTSLRAFRRLHEESGPEVAEKVQQRLFNIAKHAT